MPMKKSLRPPLSPPVRRRLVFSYRRRKEDSSNCQMDNGSVHTAANKFDAETEDKRTSMSTLTRDLIGATAVAETDSGEE